MKNSWKSYDKDMNHRFVILTDLENEPDDSQTMVKLLMYSNEIDIEGLIAVSGTCLVGRVFPESIRYRVQAYGLVRDNLCKHAKGWPEMEDLLGKIAAGQTGLGMSDVGDGKDSAGAKLIMQVLEKDDPRPVWFAINAGANTLAQALWSLRKKHTPDKLKEILAKVKVYDDMGQDDAGAWIAHTFPEIHYQRSYQQVAALFGPKMGMGPQAWLPLNQFIWAERNIRTDHGILGALYPQRMMSKKTQPYEHWVLNWDENPQHFHFMDGGGSTSLLGLINKGLFCPDEMTWGGWGGRFSDKAEEVEAWFATRGSNAEVTKEGELRYSPYLMFPQASDSWYDPIEKKDYPNNENAPVWRWRREFVNDFKARMDWCVENYEDANHHPEAAFFDDMERTILVGEAEAGEKVSLDASKSTDPDGDGLLFDWSIYPEAGTYEGKVVIDNPLNAVTAVTIPKDASGKQIHVILKVTDDNNEAPLSSYRRLVINIK
jgi:hypothetical protein